ncbi:MAG: hypothetical protein R3E97_17325 [Candidatus Eisenbacteria bacterium]
MTQLAFNWIVALLFTALAAAVDITVFRDRDRWSLGKGELVSVLAASWVLGSLWNYVFSAPSLGWLPYLAPFFVVAWLGYGFCLWTAWRRDFLPMESLRSAPPKSELERAAGIVVSSYLVVLLLAVLTALLGRAVLGTAA